MPDPFDYHMILAPGAELVPHHEPWSREAQELVQLARGSWWTVFVHCGPSAPLPARARPYFYVPAAPYFSLPECGCATGEECSCP